MRNRWALVGAFTGLLGLVFMAAGGVMVARASAGLASLDAVYEIEDLHISYDDDGNFVDRGSVEQGKAILSMLTDDWKYPVVWSDLDPNDSLINTPTELMLQRAIITYHVTHGTQTIVLEEDVEYNGQLFKAGTYEFPIEGRHWEAFDRKHPLEGPARGQAWNATVHGLLGNLSTGTVADMAAGLAHVSGLLWLGLGFGLVLLGSSMVWAERDK